MCDSTLSSLTRVHQANKLHVARNDVRVSVCASVFLYIFCCQLIAPAFFTHGASVGVPFLAVFARGASTRGAIS